MALFNLDEIKGTDIRKYPVQIAHRVWWVGHVLDKDTFQCHVYLIEQGDQSVLIDPGSKLTFRHTLRKIEEVIPFSKIKYFISHHQDPDITAAYPLIDEMISRDDAVMICHWRSQALLKHYDLKLPFWLIEDHDWLLKLEDRTLKFIFTPYAHFPGAFCSFDEKTQVLFSSDIFGGFTEKFSLIAEDEGYFEALRPFHEHYIPHKDILAFAMSQIEKYPIKMILPQHGSIIPEHLIKFMISRLKDLDCGLYLLTKTSVDIKHLSNLNQALRDILTTMVAFREFRDIVGGLLHIIRRFLPVETLEFYSRLEGGEIQHLSQENRYRGKIEPAPPEIDELMKEDNHLSPVDIFDYRIITIHPEDDSESPCIVLPLVQPDAEKILSVALIHLKEKIDDNTDIKQIVKQMHLPLQVAIERETIYRTIELERQKYYDRAIRDTLTGLYTRIYMHDSLQRIFHIHDRDKNAMVAIAMLDIDHFKKVNDTFGHNQGDVVLKGVAQVVLNLVRSADIPIRLGGEEFAIFLVGSSANNIKLFAEKLRKSIESMKLEEPMEGKNITVSLGVAIRHQKESITDLIERADTALYRAKNTGRNQVCEAQ